MQIFRIRVRLRKRSYFCSRTFYFLVGKENYDAVQVTSKLPQWPIRRAHYFPFFTSDFPGELAMETLIFADVETKDAGHSPCDHLPLKGPQN